MKNLSITFFITALLAGSLSYAGGIGNGGFGLECTEKDGSLSYKLYDYYEFRNEFTPDLGGPGLTTMERVNYVLKRLNRINPSRAQKYKKLVAEFFNDQEELKPEDNFIPVQDLGAATIPKNCKLLQLAQQRGPNEKPTSKTKTYVVDKELLKKIENAGYTDVIAGLALHESTYNEHLHWPNLFNVNTTLVRYFNALISSNNISRFSELVYLQTITGINRMSLVPSLDYRGIEINVWRTTGPNNPNPEEVHFTLTNSEQANKGLGVPFETKYGILNCENGSILYNTGEITYCYNKSRVPLKISPIPEEIQVAEISFYKNGNVKDLKLSGGNQVITLSGTKERVSTLGFDESGAITRKMTY